MKYYCTGVLKLKNFIVFLSNNYKNFEFLNTLASLMYAIIDRSHDQVGI